MKYIFCFLFHFLAIGSFAQTDLDSVARSIEEEASILYRSEMASWYGTDIFIEKLADKKEISLENKIAIIVDDGVATGLTMQAGIMELRDRNPLKIIAAVPVAPRTTAHLLENLADGLVAVEIPDDYEFRGSVGAYYDEFDQVEDAEVIKILKNY